MEKYYTNNYVYGEYHYTIFDENVNEVRTTSNKNVATPDDIKNLIEITENGSIISAFHDTEKLNDKYVILKDAIKGSAISALKKDKENKKGEKLFQY